MPFDDLKAAYQLIAELLVSPQQRDTQWISQLHQSLGAELGQVEAHLAKFFALPASESDNEYLQTLELAPTCPLYLGSHLYDEPSTCSGIGTSGRNAYMLELTGLYQHFQLDLDGGELPDFLPVMVDFMWLSLESSAPNQVALRRWFLEHHVQEALEQLAKSLAKYHSSYGLVISALQEAVACDLRRMGDAPAWRPPDGPAESDVSLPVLNIVAMEATTDQTVVTELEIHP